MATSSGHSRLDGRARRELHFDQGGAVAEMHPRIGFRDGCSRREAFRVDTDVMVPRSFVDVTFWLDLEVLGAELERDR